MSLESDLLQLIIFQIFHFEMARRKGPIIFFGLILFVTLFIYVINRSWLHEVPLHFDKIESENILLSKPTPTVNRDHGQIDRNNHPIAVKDQYESLSSPTQQSQVPLRVSTPEIPSKNHSESGLKSDFSDMQNSTLHLEDVGLDSLKIEIEMDGIEEAAEE